MSEFVDHLLESLEPLGGVTARRMFGGRGLFKDGAMFALITGDDRVYFKVDEATEGRFAAAGLEPFTYTRARTGQSAVMSYRAAPEAAYDDPAELRAWARLGWDAAFRQAQAKPKPKSKRGKGTRS